MYNLCVVQKTGKRNLRQVSSSVIPSTKKEIHEEVVLDARMCVLSDCPFLERKRVAGETVVSCGAQIFQAEVPLKELESEIERNPTPEPSGEDNPFLLRILMSPHNTTSYCGLLQVSYEEEVLDLGAEQAMEELFSASLSIAT